MYHFPMTSSNSDAIFFVYTCRPKLINPKRTMALSFIPTRSMYISKWARVLSNMTAPISINSLKLVAIPP
jgi:hypothetical protein